MTSEVQTELFVQVVLPNGELKALRVLVDFGGQAVALANPNVVGDQISDKYESPLRRLVLQADNQTPLPWGDEQIDVHLRGSCMVVFRFLVLPNVACPHMLSQIYLQIWFWGTHGGINIA